LKYWYTLLEIDDYIKQIEKQHQKKWLQYVQGMGTNGVPKQALQYKPKGRRNIGRPRKRWRDQLHRGWTQTEYQNKHYNTEQKDEGT
jgi:hypothetical protein